MTILETLDSTIKWADTISLEKVLLIIMLHTHNFNADHVGDVKNQILLINSMSLLINSSAQIFYPLR